jgi:hypothetical protein
MNGGRTRFQLVEQTDVDARDDWVLNEFRLAIVRSNGGHIENGGVIYNQKAVFAILLHASDVTTKLAIQAVPEVPLLWCCEDTEILSGEIGVLFFGTVRQRLRQAECYLLSVYSGYPVKAFEAFAPDAVADSGEILF